MFSFFKRRANMANEQEQNTTAQTEETLEQNASEQVEVAEESIESLQAKIAQLNDDLKLEKARTANAVYEAQKSVERIQRESEKHKDAVLEKFAKELLDTVDNLERALQAVGEDEGIQLTLKSLLTTLEKFGVVVVDTANGFNADFHQAVGIDPNAKANEIGTVLQKGYTLNGRLLRPAMVMVGA